jgi:ABC-type branched-subunit amino acid transport system ATPase component
MEKKTEYQKNTKELKQIRVKVTERQHHMIKSQAQDIDLTIQDFVRFNLLGFNGLGKVPYLNDMLGHLGKMSSNLNQATREINSDKFKSNLNDDLMRDIKKLIEQNNLEVSKLRMQLRELSKHDAH